MSHTELDRFGVITRLRERRLTQIDVARILKSRRAPGSVAMRRGQIVGRALEN